MRANVVLWVVGTAAALALIPVLPYGYYSVMRWVMCATCAYLAVQAYRGGHEGWAWCWGVIAGIYNPIVPVHASRAVWSIVNVATILAAVWCSKSTQSLQRPHAP